MKKNRIILHNYLVFKYNNFIYTQSSNALGNLSAYMLIQ